MLSRLHKPFRLRATFILFILLLTFGAVLWGILDRKSLPRVAHAGGAYNGHKYTNSLEALDYNSVNFDYFEIDLNFTIDGHLVCAHEWATVSPENTVPPTLAEFQALKHVEPFERCTLSTLADWLIRNPDKKIITDAKQRNIEVLRTIILKWPELADRFIPQIYDTEEYTHIRNLGYKDIILTTYRYSGTFSELIESAGKIELFAITVPKSMASLTIELLNNKSTPIYTHTVNKKEEILKLKCLGISEFYTDFISPKRYNPRKRDCPPK